METLIPNHTEIALLSALLVLFIIQITYYMALYGRVYRRNKKAAAHTNDAAEPLPPLSVIICARDELANLREFLPQILEQDYPEFEVIVINDKSSDDSGDYLQLLAEKYDNLYNSFMPESSRYISHKKMGITLGMKASKHDWLVFTEPNCRPAGKHWLRTLARNFTPDTDIVLGCYAYENGKRKLNRKISIDTLFNTMRMLGFALAGKPYTGCGRNMAYRKSLFKNSKGFSQYLNLQRGDDDLFINQVATAKNTRVETSPEAVMWLKTLDYEKPWKEDKLNYAVTSHFYKGNQKYVLGAETFSRLLFLFTAIGMLVYGSITLNPILIGTPIVLWLVRFLIQGMVFSKTAKSIGDQQKYRAMLPGEDFLQPLRSLRFKLLRLSRDKSEFMRR